MDPTEAQSYLLRPFSDIPRDIPQADFKSVVAQSYPVAQSYKRETRYSAYRPSP